MSEQYSECMDEAEFRPISLEVVHATMANFTEEMTFHEKLAKLRKAANDDPTCDYVAPQNLRTVVTVAVGEVMTGGYECCGQDEPRLQ